MSIYLKIYLLKILFKAIECWTSIPLKNPHKSPLHQDFQNNNTSWHKLLLEWSKLNVDESIKKNMLVAGGVVRTYKGNRFFKIHRLRNCDFTRGMVIIHRVGIFQLMIQAFEFIQAI